jgi:CspA family cold shock protein
MNGKVKFFDPDKGWGFITRDDGKGDVFIHINDVPRDLTLTQDMPVTFEVEASQKGNGMKAKKVAAL